MYIRLVDVRQRQSDDADVGPSCLPHRFGGSGHRRRRDRHHQPHRRIHLEDRLRFCKRLVAVVVARPDGRERQLRMSVGDALADERNPFVLVRGGQRPGDHRELTAAVEQPRRFVSQRVADPFGCRLVDEEVARVGLGVGVPGQHADATIARLAQHGGNRGAVLDRDGDCVDMTGDPVLDELVLLRRVEARRSVPDQLHVLLARRLLRAGAAADEVRIALRLRHHGDNRAVRAAGRRGSAAG